MKTRCLAIAFALLAVRAVASAQPTFQTILQLGTQNSVDPLGAAPDGNLYTTDDVGAVQIKHPARAGGRWKLIHLGIPGGAGWPMVPAPGGGLYVSSGAGSDPGEVDLISPPASPGGAWTQSALYTFTGTPDGAFPENLIVGADGSIYGATGRGGQYGYGTVFQLSPPSVAGGSWAETILYSFAGPPNDSENPEWLLIGTNGSLYGVANGGNQSSECQFDGCGTVFQLAPPSSPGGPWQEALIYEFQSVVDGYLPQFLVAAPDGTLYGSTTYGGPGNGIGYGTVFALTPPSSPGGAWTKTTLFNPNRGQGIYLGSLVYGADGNLYVTAATGGALCKGRTGHVCGTVFELVAPSSAGAAWTFHMVHAFKGTKTHDGASPGGLAIAADGTIYGATVSGGNGNGGTIFQITP